MLSKSGSDIVGYPTIGKSFSRVRYPYRWERSFVRPLLPPPRPIESNVIWCIRLLLRVRVLLSVVDDPLEQAGRGQRQTLFGGNSEMI